MARPAKHLTGDPGHMGIKEGPDRLSILPRLFLLKKNKIVKKRFNKGTSRPIH